MFWWDLSSFWRLTCQASVGCYVRPFLLLSLALVGRSSSRAFQRKLDKQPPSRRLNSGVTIRCAQELWDQAIASFLGYCLPYTLFVCVRQSWHADNGSTLSLGTPYRQTLNLNSRAKRHKSSYPYIQTCLPPL